jgi:hypothetical protein
MVILKSKYSIFRDVAQNTVDFSQIVLVTISNPVWNLYFSVKGKIAISHIACLAMTKLACWPGESCNQLFHQSISVSSMDSNHNFLLAVRALDWIEEPSIKCTATTASGTSSTPSFHSLYCLMKLDDARHSTEVSSKPT